MIFIDASLEHYMEERALAIALAMAGTPEEQAAIEQLADLWAALMEHRQAHSKARADAINAMAPSREEMDSKVKGLYMEQATSADVLKAHARTHFTSLLVSKRLGLALMPDNIAKSAREMQAREESFARAWIAAIGDPSFDDQMRALQREAVTMFRSRRKNRSSRFLDRSVTATTNDPTASFSPPRTHDQNR